MRIQQKYFTVLLAIVILVISGPRICLSKQCQAVKIDRHACCHKTDQNVSSINATCCKLDQAPPEGTLTSIKTTENSERIPLEFTWIFSLNTLPKTKTNYLSAYKNTGQAWGEVYSPVLRI
ncbi:MAG: hypothetical protein ACD_73C00662G0003 [uncultured bacterium]|nr:MAG: hypothetical protein ACD_73C00662G0003 [uncultured bacterium]